MTMAWYGHLKFGIDNKIGKYVLAVFFIFKD
jgi:uncharacterized protein (DUF486 family)